MKTSKDMQTLRYGAIAVAFALFSGINLPVMSLMLLDKGLDLSSLALALGAYGLVVVVCEIPSGFISDRYGRKVCFMASAVLSAIGNFILIGGGGLGRIVPALSAMGVARALSSGALEALYIDWYVALGNQGGLPRITKLFSIWQTIGFSAGSLIGGALTALPAAILPAWFGPYDIQLAVSATGKLCVAVFVIVWMSEPSQPAPDRAMQSVKAVFRFITTDRVLMQLTLCTAATGLLLGSLEKYWQPRFFSITQGSDPLFLLGILSFSGFAAALAGNSLAGSLLIRKHHATIGVYIVLRMALASAMAVLAMTFLSVPFIVLYPLVYLALGMANIAEGVIANSRIQSAVRASVLSILSFVFQAGGMLSSAIGSVTALKGEQGITVLWLTAAAGVAVTAAIMIRR